LFIKTDSLANTFSENEGVKSAAREIVNAAKSRGSVDNITAVVVFLRDVRHILEAYDRNAGERERLAEEETAAKAAAAAERAAKRFNQDGPFSFGGYKPTDDDCTPPRLNNMNNAGNESVWLDPVDLKSVCHCSSVLYQIF
jgi:hypothetical protein